MRYTLMLASDVYRKQKIWKYKIASHLGLGGSVVSSGHSTLRPQGVQCGGAFMSLDPAAREERTSAQITTCVVALPHRHHGGRWLNSGALYKAANWWWCGCERPFALIIWGITLSLDLCRELKRCSLWVTALATINVSWALGCFASRVRVGKPNGGGRPRLNIHKFFLRTCILIGRIAGYACRSVPGACIRCFLALSLRNDEWRHSRPLGEIVLVGAALVST